MFRLGDDLVARLRFTPGGADDVRREAQWLPALRAALPVRTPGVKGVGRPGAGYPLPWLVLDWLPGDLPEPGRLADPEGFAADVTDWILALRAVPPAGAPEGGRGRMLALRDAKVRRALAEASDLVDVPWLTHIWEEALIAPAWEGPPVWTHGDLLTGNVLVGTDGPARGRLTGVLDFAGAGLSEPAGDLVAAWALLDRGGRRLLRGRLGAADPDWASDATWARGRGWALEQAIQAVPYYRESFPRMTRSSLHTLEQIIAG